jgi:hypothetical protein
MNIILLDVMVESWDNKADRASWMKGELMQRYRIIADDLPFEFSCGNSTASDLQARQHLMDFKLTPTSFTLQKILKRGWVDVCRRNLSTGCTEWPNGDITATPMEHAKRVPLTGNETIKPPLLSPAAQERAVAYHQTVASVYAATEPSPQTSPNIVGSTRLIDEDPASGQIEPPDEPPDDLPLDQAPRPRSARTKSKPNTDTDKNTIPF